MIKMVMTGKILYSDSINNISELLLAFMYVNVYKRLAQPNKNIDDCWL